MAVHSATGTLTASTVSTVTLTSWQKYIIVNITGTATAAPISITVDGSTPTVGGADTTTVQIAANGTAQIALKNLLPAPELSTTTPLASDPSAVPALTTAQSVIKLISAQTMTYSVELSPNPGSATVLA